MVLAPGGWLIRSICPLVVRLWLTDRCRSDSKHHGMGGGCLKYI